MGHFGAEDSMSGRLVGIEHSECGLMGEADILGMAFLPVSPALEQAVQRAVFEACAHRIGTGVNAPTALSASKGVLTTGVPVVSTKVR